MRRVVGIDIHRTFGEVVIWEAGKLKQVGRVDMTRTALEDLGKSLQSSDEVVIEATGNAMAVSRVLLRFVARVIIANPLQVKAIAHAHVKTDKIDAGVLASLHAAVYLPEIWTPDAETERRRRLVARRYQIVRHRTRRGQNGELHPMATIGTFKKTGPHYSGEIAILTVQAKNVRITHEEARSHENAPHFRVFAVRAEIGAAWAKTSGEGRTYLSLKLDDPSLPAPIFASLVQDESTESFSLIWSRPNARQARN